MDDSDDRILGVRARLEERNKTRLTHLEKRREKKAERKNEEESVTFFTNRLQNGLREIQNKLSNTSNVDKGQLTNHFDSLAKDVQVLQKFISDSAIFLPSYDLQASQKQLAEIQVSIDERREFFMPKKKFAFKMQRKQASKQGTASNVQEPSSNASTSSYGASSEFHGFKDLKDQTVTLSKVDAHQRDITFSNLHGCTVVVFGSPAVLHMKSLVKCIIKCGPTSRAIFVNDCKDTHFSLACQQLRIHNTFDSIFRIHVTSRAIIEDCKGLGFGKYDIDYAGLQDDFSSSGLSQHVNNWNLVDDFNWLKLSEKSPNWYILPDENSETQYA